MSRLFSTAITSMQAHSAGIDVHANNIANVNTTGYKSLGASFKTLFSELLRPASADTATVAGQNAMQVGAGVQTATTAVDFEQGSLEHTGNSLDLAIQGKGFLVLADRAGNRSYTRDGQLSLDSTGRLVHAASGNTVQGLLVDAATGTIPQNAVPQDIVIPPGLTLNAKATGTSTIAGNLDAATTTGATAQMQWQYNDSFGVTHIMTVVFTKSATANSWDWDAQVGPGNTSVGTGTIVFNSVGDVNTGGSGTTGIDAASGGLTAGSTDPQAITLDFSKMTQFAAGSEVASTNQDGFAPGSLQDVTTDENGTVSTIFSNGQTRAMAMLALANFANVQGLNAKPDNLWTPSANAGSAQVVSAGTAGVGTVLAQTLERSNVDMATELTQLIVLQRGYQAATRLITTADEMMQDALNLKR